jgi:phosphinothricin acetyltransferase
MNIEHASEHDLAAIVAIYNDAIATSTAVFSDQPVTIEHQREWLALRRERGYPVLVAREQGALVAFASYGDFRPWPGYRFTVEHSVYVTAAMRRRGIARRLVSELIASAREDGKHAMIAGIDAENDASLRLHSGLGFEQVGRLSEVARKFDRWLDLVFMELQL